MNEAQLEFLELYGKNIIMMDSTHGTNQYGYLLTTIMVSDDNHEGLPIAVCYSNRKGKLTSKISTIRMCHEKGCKEMQGYSAEELTPTKLVVYKTMANGITTYEIK
ncbi:hypothetical protein TNCT_559661 [Trichonephila clavata]|uniref:ZSWIM1/3 RNaseH-like domain-containing protein n=1 Tax=Trichonephila clavata TaxID=2740835 RepID=A0A8X6IHD4_TRICU|nr:hypothetical protein TNCT_559661 [Trichonephila clavata]